MKRWRYGWFAGLILLSGLSVVEPVVGQERAVVRPPLTQEAVVNPGKGWVVYGNATGQTPEQIALASIGYKRYHWGDLEPSPGVYRWDIIDRDLASWQKLGKGFAFGVMCASSHAAQFWTTPKWVFDAGAKYSIFHNKPQRQTMGTEGEKLVPCFDDSVFLVHLSDFIHALGKRYDGHPALAFVDIRSYGNWGEGHMHPFNVPNISEEMYRKHIEMHLEAFKETQLMLPSGNTTCFGRLYEWSVRQGIGLRRDGVCGNSDGSEVVGCYGKMPAVFELFGYYDFLKREGWWDGIQNKQGYGFTLESCIERGKPTYCDLSRGGAGGMLLVEREPELVRRLGNRLGYHIVVREVRFDCQLECERSTMKVDLIWENQGVAPCYEPVEVRFALIDRKGKPETVCKAVISCVEKFAPDVPVTVAEQLTFPSVKKGSYHLAVGLVDRRKGGECFLKLGNELPECGGWYLLGEVEVW